MSLAIAQIVSECIRNRDDPVTFLPLLATIVTHRVMGRLVKHKSDYTRRLSYEESYRVVRASLERLHRRANRRLFYMDGNRIEVDKGYDDDDKTIVDGCKKGSYLKFVHWDSTQIRLRDSKIQMITYELLEIGMKMTDSDIEFVIGSCRVDL